MEALSHQTLAVALTLLPAALVFGLVSFAAKGRGVVAALRQARGESVTNLALVVINSLALGSLVKFADASIEA
jgi:hypothetical protein